MARITYVVPKIIGNPEVVRAVRHGESVGNVLGVEDQSLEDKPNHLLELTERGNMEISLSADYILENRLIKPRTRLYTSGFLRAQQSMKGILDKQEGDFEVCIDSRLDEWWKGVFHSMSEDELLAHYPAEERILAREMWHHYRAPQGQAGKDVDINLLSFMQDVTGEAILFTGHGRSIGLLRRLLTNQPMDLNCAYSYPSNGAIWEFRRNGDYYDFQELFKPEVD